MRFDLATPDFLQPPPLTGHPRLFLPVPAGLHLRLEMPVLIGLRGGLGAWYYASVVISAGLMAYHLWLARDRQPAACFEAFLHNRHIGMVVFIGIVLHYAFNP